MIGDLSFLAALVSTDETRSDWIRRPWSLDWRGKQWAGATDGKGMLVVEAESEHAPVPGAPAASILDTGADVPLHPVSLDALRTWVGEPDPEPSVIDQGKCSLCEGTGDCECDRCYATHPCGKCNGWGTGDGKRPGRVPEKVPRFGRVLGMLLDLDLVHRWLRASIPWPSEVQVGIVPGQHVVIAADGWRCVVMGMREGPGSWWPAEHVKPRDAAVELVRTSGKREGE